MAKKKSEKNEEKVKNKVDLKPLKRAVNRVAKTKDGQIVFNYIMNICGFALSSLVIDPESLEINAISSVYNESRKTVYYQLRNLIDKEVLKEIEYMQLKEDADNDN